MRAIAALRSRREENRGRVEIWALRSLTGDGLFL
jgi:hypothetical protein